MGVSNAQSPSAELMRGNSHVDDELRPQLTRKENAPDLFDNMNSRKAMLKKQEEMRLKIEKKKKRDEEKQSKRLAR